MKHCMVGYGNFYDLINKLDITDLNLIRGAYIDANTLPLSYHTFIGTRLSHKLVERDETCYMNNDSQLFTLLILSYK